MVFSEADSAELQEAVDKTTFSHDFNNLEAATTYSIYLRAYSAQGGSQQSSTITATTQGGGETPETHLRQTETHLRQTDSSSLSTPQFPALPLSSPRC